MPRQGQQQFSTPNGSIYTSEGQLWGPEAYSVQSQIPQFVRQFYSGATPVGWTEPGALAGQPIVQTPTATPSPSAAPSATPAPWSPGAAANQWTDPSTGETFYYDADWNYVGTSGPGSASVGGTAIRDFGGGSAIGGPIGTANQWTDPSTGETHYYDENWNWLYSQPGAEAAGQATPEQTNAFQGAEAGAVAAPSQPQSQPSPAGSGGSNPTSSILGMGLTSLGGGQFALSVPPSLQGAGSGTASLVQSLIGGQYLGLGTVPIINAQGQVTGFRTVGESMHPFDVSSPGPWMQHWSPAVGESSGTREEQQAASAAAKLGMTQEQYDAQQEAAAAARAQTLSTLGDPTGWQFNSNSISGIMGGKRGSDPWARHDTAVAGKIAGGHGGWTPVWSPAQLATLKLLGLDQNYTPAGLAKPTSSPSQLGGSFLPFAPAPAANPTNALASLLGRG